MSFVPESWIVRMLIGRGLRAPDIEPPYFPYRSWADYFAGEGYAVGLDFLPLGDPAPEGCRANLVWTRVGQDVATVDLHFVNADGPDTVPFIDADRDTLEPHLMAMWDALKPKYSDEIALDRIVWHDFGVGIRAPNPARRTTILTPDPGTGTEVELPPQVATSVTLKTDHRRSWGRFYLPAPDVSVMSAGGYLADTYCDDVRTAVGTLADAAAAAGLPLVVWSPRHGGALLKYTSTKPKPSDYVLDVPDTSSVARSVTVVQVDDIADVIRSRRNKKPLHLATHTL